MTELRPAPAVTSLFELFDRSHIADPYPIYAALRATTPRWRPVGSLVVLSRHGDGVALLRDARFGHGEPDELARPGRGGAASARDERRLHSFIGLNPPDHTRLRKLVSSAFTPSRVAALAPRIEELVDELLAAAAAGSGAFDLVAALAGPLPVIVISELLGIPPHDRGPLVAWSHAMARGLDPAFLLPTTVRSEIATARLEFGTYLRGLISRRRLEPGDDLLSALIEVHDRGDALSEDELVATCILLLIAGHETTTNLVANGALALLRNRDALERLAMEPTLIAHAVEELLRYDSPVQLTGRIALEDAAIGELNVTRGTFVLVLIGAANRDPEAYVDPDVLDISREPSRHLAFGQGIHFCLGAPLARLESQIALRSLVERPGRLELAGTPSWKQTAVLRGVESLPVAFGPR